MSAFEVTDKNINEFRLQLVDSFWNKQEVVNDETMKNDRKELMKLPESEQNFILSILAFFATGDDEVIDLIYGHLNPHITCSSWRCYEIMKQANEMIHNETYSGLIDYLAPEKKQMLLKSPDYKFVQEKLSWVKSLLDGNLITAVFLLMITEQLFFSSSFCAIFWYKEVREIMRGLAISNELISRDEGLHYRCGLYIYHKLGGMDTEKAVEILKSAVEIERKFVHTITPETVGMNPVLMSKYVEYIADNIAIDIGAKKIYGSECPFGFMSQFGVRKRVDFFHRKSTAYNTYVVEPYDSFRFIV